MLLWFTLHFLITMEFKHLFHIFIGPLSFFFWKTFCMYLSIFFTELFALSYLICSHLHILNNYLLSVTCGKYILLLLVFSLYFMATLAVQNFLILTLLNLLINFFQSYACFFISQNPGRSFPYITSKSFFFFFS